MVPSKQQTLVLLLMELMVLSGSTVDHADAHLDVAVFGKFLLE
jgi:hypothetical protein